LFVAQSSQGSHESYPAFVILNRLEEHAGDGASIPKFEFDGW
jgi:hypothetical protein